MDLVLTAVLPLFGLIAAGYVCARKRLFGPGAVDSLNKYVVWLALPALLFQAMAHITWDQLDHPGFAWAFTLGIAVVFAASYAMDRQRRGRLADASIEGLAASYPNAGFMGIPLCLAVFGRDSLPAAIITALLTACVLFAFSIVLIEIDLQGTRSLARTLRKVLLSVLRNPLVASPLAGLVFPLMHWRLPGPVEQFVGLLSDSASPCALVTIGLFLAQSAPAAGRQGAVWRIVGLKMLLQPAVTAALAYWVFDMPPMWAQAAVLLSALPIGTGPFMLAKLYDREAAVTSRAILISTVLSVASVSALVAVFRPGH
ncbi:AEC family transporter [Candidimonas humi]|uniref:AEC family transporter n=1 Tax=Candidimonas humi TaxID=683355 RepID=A0ABV8NW23_9BURK|nr:AEC family transporter [Candidimonas humi]MBV6304321.1 AEC family transporter [Candidimonas humi]